MKINANSLLDFSLQATDGEIGTVETMYFDDETWTIRYLVVKTGSWLSGRKVLISPEAVLKGSWGSNLLPVNLTKEQVSSSPNIDTDKPVSRQQEAELFTYYPWQNYWSGGLYVGGIWDIAYPVTSMANPSSDINDQPQQDKNEHLRSTEHVAGYTIQAIDGDIGHVKDFIIDDQTWQLLFLVVDTHNWFGGIKVLIPVSAIKEVNWENTKVIIKMDVDAVKNSKLFNESEFAIMDSNQF